MLREFVKRGHKVTAVTPFERREKKNTLLTHQVNFTNLQVKSLNIQKVNVLEKGAGMLLLSHQFYRAMKKNNLIDNYDLILYSTPPITLYDLIRKIKNKTNAVTYLLLKDIFPQNAIDMKMMRENSILHRYFSSIEQKLYSISDHIGCMSQANVDFVRRNHPDIEISKLHVNPNSIEPILKNINQVSKAAIKEKYNLPTNKLILVYGGNLGKPQGIDFLIKVIQKTSLKNVHYLVVGGGSEFDKINLWFHQFKPENASLLSSLPKIEYDKLLQACDIGLIFLNKDFTIPNFPSRLLSYLEMGMPVISCTDVSTDIGDFIETWKCGFKIISGDSDSFIDSLDRFANDSNLRRQYSQNAIRLLESQFTVSRSVDIILSRLNDKISVS